MKRVNISLPEKVKQKIIQHAEACYPAECCGVLFGDAEQEDRIIDFVPTENQSDRKHRHFTMDPLQLFTLEQQYWESGLLIAGFVHSHPDQPAILSEEDKRDMLPELPYLILEVRQGRATDLCCWRKSDGQEEELAIN